MGDVGAVVPERHTLAEVVLRAAFYATLAVAAARAEELETEVSVAAVPLNTYTYFSMYQSFCVYHLPKWHMMSVNF